MNRDRSFFFAVIVVATIGAFFWGLLLNHYSDGCGRITIGETMPELEDMYSPRRSGTGNVIPPAPAPPPDLSAIALTETVTVAADSTETVLELPIANAVVGQTYYVQQLLAGEVQGSAANVSSELLAVNNGVVAAPTPSATRQVPAAQAVSGSRPQLEAGCLVTVTALPFSVRVTVSFGASDGNFVVNPTAQSGATIAAERIS